MDVNNAPVVRNLAVVVVVALVVYNPVDVNKSANPNFFIESQTMLTF